MHVTIRPLDPSSDLELEQINALDEACDEDAFGGREVLTVDQRRARLSPSEYFRARRFVAVAETIEGGQSIVGIASVEVPLKENLEDVYVGLGVHPAFRGHGIGTALLEQAVIPAVRESGRTRVGSFGEIPADGDADDPALPANRLAARLGIERKNIAICRTLALPLADDLMDRLECSAREKQGEYRIEVWDDEVPEEHLAAYGVLLRQLDLDDPDEDFEFEAADYTPERIRDQERRRRERGTREIIAVAIAPDGTMVGNSVIDVQTTPGTTIGWQENTLVMPDHRGHRLGLALKVAVHRELARTAPDLQALATWNSHVNPWMIAINEQLGYEIAHREIAYQGAVAHDTMET